MIRHILVIGKNGQLGLSLQQLISDSMPSHRMTSGTTFTFVGRDELDLASSESITDFFKNKHFDAIINCAAYTAVDKAESEPELAEQINHFAVTQLADIAKQREIPLIHISTDYVFNGGGFKPYIETDPTDPQNVYGLTKLKGEQGILASGCRGAIIRTSWVYSEFGSNFVKTMLRLGKERDSLSVIYDQVGSPTYATDLARALLTVLMHFEGFPRHSDGLPRHSGEGRNLATPEMPDQSLCRTRSGIQHDAEVKVYHYTNEGVCSWYDFAKAIFELSGVNCQVNPIETKDYPTPAKRPHYSVMNKAQIKQDQPGLVVPYWRDSLQVCLNALDIKR